MFHIKICGITNIDDALAAASAGADAIGLNFYRGSKRYLEVVTAQSIGRSLPAGVKKVGVFVNARAEQIVATAAQVGLDIVQLHGDEPAQLLQELPRQLAIIRAFRCGAQGLEPLHAYLEECRAGERNVAAVLIDANAGDNYGGTGQVADWERIVHDRGFVGETPIILGGGLTPKNVAEAIARVRPAGVDVASGVEQSPGRKDTLLVQQFIASAGKAFASLR